MSILFLHGAPAFTPARLAKRLKKIQAQNPGVQEIASEFVHIVDLGEALSDEERHVLDRLLQYGPRTEAHGVSGQHLLVVPRLGTISPWSSKATDVAHNCGLAKVKRIERGIWYTMAGTIAAPAALRAAISDRMTESVLENEEAAASLFHHAAPKPLSTVDVLGGGRRALERYLNHMEALIRATREG